MPTTSNFGWTTPADTDLVKDGASAIRTLGNGIDSSFIDLKGGTTGQVLSKASNTDLDFSWVAQDDSNAIQNALLTTTGDTIYASAASTPARLGIGSTGQVLTVAGGVPSWATPATSDSFTLLSTTNITSTSAINITGISTSYNELVIFVENFKLANDNVNLNYRFNNNSSSVYAFAGVHSFGNVVYFGGATYTLLRIGGFDNINNTGTNTMIIRVPFYASTSTYKCGFVTSMADYGNGTDKFTVGSGIGFASTTAITEFNIFPETGNFTANGAIKIYGVK